MTTKDDLYQQLGTFMINNIEWPRPALEYAFKLFGPEPEMLVDWLLDNCDPDGRALAQIQNERRRLEAIMKAN